MERVTQHQLTYRLRLYALAAEDNAAFFRRQRSRAVEIGHDVWIHHGAKIMTRVAIGTGAVIDAGAVVTRDDGPNEIAVGSPARVVRRCFPEDLVERLVGLGSPDARGAVARPLRCVLFPESRSRTGEVFHDPGQIGF